jgi:hypothetical protein
VDKTQRDILHKGGKTYEWDELSGGWVRSYDAEYKFSREQAKPKKEPVPELPRTLRWKPGGIFALKDGKSILRYAKDEQGNELRHTTHNRTQRRGAAAITRGRHYNPDALKMVPGSRTVAKRKARRELAAYRDFIRAVSAERKKHG